MHHPSALPLALLLLAFLASACGAEQPAQQPDAAAPCGGACGPGTTCSAGRCVAVEADAAVDDRPPDGLEAVADVGSEAASLDAALDSPADGADGAACPPGRTLIAGVCMCGVGITECRGECVDTNRSVLHCGGCGRACRGDENCRDGVCERAAGDGGADARPDVCSSMTPTNCCGVVCPTPPGTEAVCAAGFCVMQCAAGRENCDGTFENGCEVNTTSDLAHCGVCYRRCSAANASATCTAGVCRVDRCLPGFADCDGAAGNGCETETSANQNNCGRCGLRCLNGQTCVAGSCVGEILCTPPEVRCGAGCVDPRGDRNNCGACGSRCPTPAGATVACVAGSCTVTTCAAASDGQADCDRDPANGCEANLNNSINCGACGTVCGTNRWCAPGRVCACVSSLVDCGGHCVRLTDPANCGRCGNACSDREICSGSPVLSCNSCGEDTPSTMRRRCDNTCVDLLNDEHNCGACGNDCGRTRLCFNGVCRSL